MKWYAVLIDGLPAETARRQAAGAGDVEPRLAARRLTLFAHPGLAWLSGTQSLLLGRMFDKGSNRAIATSADLDRAIAGGAATLVRHYWGQYVLIVESAGGGVVVIRDPSGAMPCFHGRIGSHEFLASDAHTAHVLGLLDHARTDPIFAAHWLQFPYLRTARTGVTDIREVVPGSLHSVGQDAPPPTRLWMPARFTVPSSRDAVETATELRRLTLAAVDAQFDGRPTMLQLSGGLDSSIVAACLAKAGRPVRAVSFATSSRDGDESDHAAAVAGHFGFPLTVLAEDRSPDLPDAAPAFRPGPNILLAGIDRAIERHRADIGAELVLDGGGGDSLFGFSNTAAPVVDGLSAGRGWATLQSVSERSGASWWRVARAAVRQAARPSARRWAEDRHFLDPAATLPNAGQHPWLDDIDRLPPGKAEHLSSLLHIQHFLDRHAIGGDHLHPLYCQPLIEYCLSVPSWMWNARGRDRAIARAAFAGALPARIVDRRSKGSLEGYFHRRYRALRPAIRDLVLDGELTRARIVDRDAVERALRPDAPDDGAVEMRLSEIATLEQWLGCCRRLGLA